MTHEEFWRKVRAAGPWKVDATGAINNGKACPLGAACQAIKPDAPNIPGGFTASMILSIPVLAAWAIANAADSEGDLRRPLLLRELGLTP